MIVAADADALAQVAAERMLACLRRSSARLAIRLTGGSAPERLHDVLATKPCRNAFHWNHIHRLGNNDRFVPHDGRSNFGMAQRRRFHCVPVPSRTSGRYPQELKTRRSLRACTKRSFLAFMAERPLPGRPRYWGPRTRWAYGFPCGPRCCTGAPRCRAPTYSPPR